ncbi:MAG: ABC-type transport auxiliary lipoprotein family protein, partial [Candidatus Competibacterales bacterium]
LPGVLLVRRPQADALLNGRFLAWRAAPDDPTMGVYNRHLWSIAPPEQLQTYLQRCLAKAGVADAVVLPQQPLRPDWQLDGQLTNFEQQLTGPMDTPNNARFFLAAELTLAPQTPGISTPPKVWRAQPQVAIPLADADPNRIAVGLEEALTQFCRQVVGQLTAAFPEGADS